MAHIKVDGVIEAVRYEPAGHIALVRAYERRGAAFSDVVLLTRTDLVRRLRSGKKFAIGERQEFMAGTFKILENVRLKGPRAREVLVTGTTTIEHDDLHGAPLF